MKILYVSYYGWRYGGGETYLFSLSNALNQKHDVRIFSSDQHPKTNKILSDYSFHVGGNKILNAFTRFYNPISYKALKKVLKEFQPDVVHINSLSGHVTPSVTYALKKYPVVISVHSFQMFNPELPNISKPHLFFLEMSYRWSRRHLIKTPDVFAAPSKVVVDTIPYYRSKRIIIPIGVDSLPYTPIVNYKNILFLGRVEEEKGIFILIEAFRKVVSQIPDSQLTIVGNGHDLALCHKLVRRYNLNNNVVFSNKHVTPDEARKYLTKCTILTMPSICQEAFGLSGIEALFIGRPVVASRIGGIPSWHKDAFGALVSPGDPMDLSMKLLKILLNKKTIELMSKNAVQESINYDINSHATIIENIYIDLIKKKRIIYGKQNE